MNPAKIVLRVHAVQRMFERGVSMKQVSQMLLSGETIEDYSADMPEPGRLILGFQGKRPIHMVISENAATDLTTIITVYVPDRNKWSNDFKSRKA